jgi:hypothetical protein
MEREVEIARLAAHERHRRQLARELVASALYVDLVLLAGLVVVPADELPTGRVVAPLVLGTVTGLLAAHWLAFRLAVQVTTAGTWHRAASQEAAAQLAGGLGVAALAALPFLVLPPQAALRGSLLALLAPPAVAGLAIGRLRGHSWALSAAVAVLVLLAAAVVVAVKIGSGH